MTSTSRFTIFVFGEVFGFTVSICTTVGGIGEHLVHGLIRWTLPIDLAFYSLDRQLEIVFQKPQQRLPDSTQLRKLAVYRQDCFLNPTIRIFFKSVFRFHISDRRPYN